MGPSLVFDKSFLQSLSVDEAVMLDQMFNPMKIRLGKEPLPAARAFGR